MSITAHDSALSALLLPFLQGQLVWPGRGLFLRARAGLPLLRAALPGLTCEQTFKPEVDALLRAGFSLGVTDPAQRYSCVLLLPPRQREEARVLLARAVALTEPGGRVLVSAANVAGARSLEADLERLVGPVTSLSKHKCRVFWSAPLAAMDAALLAEWQELDAVRPVAAGSFLSRPGLFAWDHIDAGSALLAEHLPASLRGRAADLGAGFGYLSAELLARCPAIDTLDVFEAEQRALELARLNLASFTPRVALDFHWHDVAAGLPHRYDVILSTPPFHADAEAQPDLGRRFIQAAAQALLPNGVFWLVANRHLAYEQLLSSEFASVRVVVQRYGFKIIAATKSVARRARV
jgi:16S rRNA (guanine1207-N2)-methyltransferase